MKKSVLLYLAIFFSCVLPSLAQDLGTDKTITQKNGFRRPDPLLDVTAYGARAVGVSGFSTTASCNRTTAITLGEASSFQNGDGITIYGCGATNILPAPGAPTVTPSIASGGTTTGIVANSATGSSRYSYKIVARDKYGALTAAGSATTITTGQASLGLRNATITTMTRSNDSVTFNTSAPSLIAAGTLIHITGTSNSDFDGWYSVNAMNTASQGVLTVTSIDSRGIGWNFGDSTSSSGGNIAFYLSNHISWSEVIGAWEYYIYGKRPGDSSYDLIGQTLPSANTWVDAQFDDYGSAYMASQTFPDYVPFTAPASATNDPLTTTIVSGAGGTSIVVANAAKQAASGQAAWFDDAPAFLAAANAAVVVQGTMYIPGGDYYPIHSHLTIPQFLTIKQSGYVSLYETIELTGNMNWFGDWGEHSQPAFGFNGSATVTTQTANPGLYMHGNGIYFAYLGFSSGGKNGGTIAVVQDLGNFDVDYVYFVTNSSGNSDYLGRAIVFRSTSSGGNNYHFRKALFAGGPNQITDKSWTPLVYFAPNQDGSGALQHAQYYNLRCMECFFNRRGVEQEMSAGNVGRFEFDGGYRQGGITPFLVIGNNNGVVSGSVIVHNVIQDTEAVGTLALLGNGGAGFNVSVDADFLFNASSDTNGIPPPLTGYRAFDVRSFGSQTGDVPNRSSEQSMTSCSVTYPYAISGTSPCNNDPMKKMFETMDFPAKHSLFWDLATPSDVSAAPATSGGSLKANTVYYYTVSAIGPDSGETVPANLASSSTTTPADRTIPVSWKGVIGAIRYNVYRCSSRCVLSDGRIQNSGNWRLVDRDVITTRINDNGLEEGQGPPTATGTGSVGANAIEVYSPAFVTVSPLSNGKSYTATDTAPITANRTYTKPDRSGTYALDLAGSTLVITGTLLRATCDSGTASVTGAVVGMPVVVSTTDGSDVGGAFNIRAIVTSAGTVTVYVCGTGKPPSEAYNVRVIQ